MAVFDAADAGNAEQVEIAFSRFMRTRRLMYLGSWFFCERVPDPMALLSRAVERERHAASVMRAKAEQSPVGFDPLTVLAIISLVVALLRLWVEWRRRP